MLTNALIKHIVSLKLKKHRVKHGQYIAEGDKIVTDLLAHKPTSVAKIVATHDWMMANAKLLKSFQFEAITVNELQLKKVSQLKTPNKALAILNMLTHDTQINYEHSALNLMLDGLQDPGNLGTIIRTADWFGIKNIVCSVDCVDVYNSKVIQACMGSQMRVKVGYRDLDELLRHSDITSYAAVLDGEPLNKLTLTTPCFLIIGNESKGISKPLLKLCNQTIKIPNFGGAESLNAAVATGILCAAFKL